jgi:hypothetical protein
MSAPTSIFPETLITVKVCFDGNTRRFKLALKEVGHEVFQDNVSRSRLIPLRSGILIQLLSGNEREKKRASGAVGRGR